MCFVCGWGKYLKVEAPKSGPGFVSRRSVLQATAVLGAGAVAGFRCEAVAQTPGAAPSDGKATMVLRNGPIYTVNGRAPWARAVAIAGRDIVYVGEEQGVVAFIGPNTQVVDLAGRMAMPGFVEGHIHPIVGSTATQGVDLQFDTRDETLAALRAYKEKLGEVPAVRGFGWRYSAFPATGPVKADLDAIWPDTPVLLLAVDGHSGWANSKALEMAGVTPDKADPIPGFSYFQRDPQTGEATGWLVEVPALMEVMKAAAPVDFDFIVNALKDWLPRAAAAGITSVFDAGIQILPNEAGFELYISLADAGLLPFRVVGSYYHNNPAIDPLPLISELRRKYQTDLVSANVLKLNMDGVDAAYTAAMLEPYSDKPSVRGDTVLNKEQLDDIVRRADAEGIDIHVHSIGDRSTRMVLDAVEAAIKVNPPRDRRNAIAHLQGVNPADLPRFAPLGVIGQFSAQWAVPDVYWSDITMKRWGAERGNTTYRFGTLLRSGANISFGTDWPAASNYSTFKPLEALEVAVTRRKLGITDEVPLSPITERISLEEAIRANTLTAAYQIRLDDKVGSIEVGKRADLIVLDRNLFETPPDQIHAARVLMTVMDGKVRHQA